MAAHRQSRGREVAIAFDATALMFFYSVYYQRKLEDGRMIEVVPLTFRRARILLTDGYSVFDGW